MVQLPKPVLLRRILRHPASLINPWLQHLHRFLCPPVVQPLKVRHLPIEKIRASISAGISSLAHSCSAFNPATAFLTFHGSTASKRVSFPGASNVVNLNSETTPVEEPAPRMA